MPLDIINEILPLWLDYIAALTLVRYDIELTKYFIKKKKYNMAKQFIKFAQISMIEFIIMHDRVLKKLND